MAAGTSTPTVVPTGGIVRRTSAALFRHPRLKLWLTLGPTATWMLVIYLASLALMLVTAFWRLNELSSQIERVWGLQNFQTIGGRSQSTSNDRHPNGRDGGAPSRSPTSSSRSRSRTSPPASRRPGRGRSCCSPS